MGGQIETCRFCGENLVDNVGDLKSKILLVFDSPNHEAVSRGYFLCGDMWNILSREFGLVGIPLTSCFVTGLWRHEVNKNAFCLNGFLESLIHLMEKFPFVFFMGSNLVKEFQSDSLDNWCGLQANSILIPSSVQVAVYAPSPYGLASGGIGEFRLALQKFQQHIKERISHER